MHRADVLTVSAPNDVGIQYKLIALKAGSVINGACTVTWVDHFSVPAPLLRLSLLTGRPPFSAYFRGRAVSTFGSVVIIMSYFVAGNANCLQCTAALFLMTESFAATKRRLSTYLGP